MNEDRGLAAAGDAGDHPSDAGSQAPAPGPAVAAGDAPRRLERAPGDRYRGGAPAGAPGASIEAEGEPAPTGTRARGIAAAVGVAFVGALGFAILGSIDLGLGLLIVSAFLGWLVAVALVWGVGPSWLGSPRRSVTAAAIAAGSIVLGLGLLWAWSRSEGGVLAPLDYLDQRFGFLAAIDVVAAAVVAAVRAR